MKTYRLLINVDRFLVYLSLFPERKHNGRKGKITDEQRTNKRKRTSSEYNFMEKLGIKMVFAS